MQYPQDFQRDLSSASIDAVGGETEGPDPNFTAAELEEGIATDGGW